MATLADKRHAMSIYITEGTRRTGASMPAVSGSLVLFFRAKTVSCLMQLLGAVCLVLVVLAHVSEALHLFPWMH
jgi:hypothetical protein